MSTLPEMRTRYETAHAAFSCVLSVKFPGRYTWDWLRAVAHMNGENTRRNDDTSDDAAMAADPQIRAAWDAYIDALHAFYRTRDGDRGFLGGRPAT